ncbi:MAG: hypothetical protein ACI9W1_001074, partial [Candidatus Azotimanducaceae bacterium]
MRREDSNKRRSAFSNHWLCGTINPRKVAHHGGFLFVQIKSLCGTGHQNRAPQSSATIKGLQEVNHAGL